MRPLLALVLALASFPPSASGAEPEGYIARGRLIDGSAILPGPPAKGSPEEAADIAAYRAAASLAGTPRWTAARADDDWSVAAAMRTYSCAIGVRLQAERQPALARLLARSGQDAFAATDKPKATFRRPRPFVGDAPDTPLCIDIPPDRRATASYTYPSGHATLGALRGLVLTQVAPDRAEPVLKRSDVFLESRRLCRVHYASDVEAGRTLAAGVFAQLQAEPAYRHDVEAAQRELAAARAAGETPSDCPTS